MAVKERTTLCTRCFNVAEGGELCDICSDDRRDATMVCVVEDPRDIVAVERTQQFRAATTCCRARSTRWRGSAPSSSGSKSSWPASNEDGVTEVILCTNPNLEGEATAMYLARLLSPLGTRVTRIASGLPVGGDLEYADELTLGRALEGRRDVDA